jgi:hypothetical protein
VVQTWSFGTTISTEEIMHPKESQQMQDAIYVYTATYVCLVRINIKKIDKKQYIKAK